MNERFHDPGAVVDSCEEHGLVPERDAGIGKFRDRNPGGFRHLLRVVELDVHPERVVLFQHGNEVIGYPERERDRRSGPDPYHFHMRYGTEFGEDPVEIVIAKHERIAPRQQHVADLRGVPYVFDALHDLFPAGDRIDIADFTFSRAMAAVHCTRVADKEQYTVGYRWVIQEHGLSSSSASGSGSS